MLSIEQLTIVAYQADFGILCRECGENEGLPTRDAICAYSAGEIAGNEGLYCDACGAEIDAPYEWTCPSCETTYSGDEAVDAENEYGWGADASHKCCDKCPGEVDSE